MIHSRVFCSWGCVSGAKTSVQTIPPNILITEVVVVLCKPDLGGSTGIGCFLYIVFEYFISVILGHIGNKYPLFVYISGLIVDGETSSILCEADVSIIPVLRAGRILFL